MVVIVPPPPTFPNDIISLFYVLDDLLSRSPILVFYGPSATPTATSNNSRIQAHIFSPAGLQSYPRLTISPSSPLYSAVNCLPREEQGDDVCRGLAFSIYKYFTELPQHVKSAWETDCSKASKFRAAPPLFSDAHAAILASRMAKVDNVADTIQNVRQALAEQSISWLDLDVVLPSGSMRQINQKARDSSSSDLNESQQSELRYGEYADMVSLFGDLAFLPTSRLKRAPSRPTGLNRSNNFNKKQKENIRRELCELLDTEENYVSKLDELVHKIATDFREKARVRSPTSDSPSEMSLTSLFPQSLDDILQVNASFLDAIRKIIEDTENEAIADIEASNDSTISTAGSPDLTGTLALSACLRTWFPKFSECYVNYTKAHSQFPQVMKNFTKDISSSFSKRIQETGEQRLMSMLIEPIQRLPRYNLYIDNILKQLPARHSAIQPLLKARDVISEICSQDAVAAPPSKVVNNLRRLIPSWPLSIKPNGRLVTAIDAIEMNPPYRFDQLRQPITHCILLIFTDQFVVLRRLSKSSVNARSLLTMIDGHEFAPSDQRADEVTFKHAQDINLIDFTEFDSSRMLQVVSSSSAIQTGRPSSRPSSLSSGDQTQVFYLSGIHEGKANRILEDITKARVEGRYSEAERESHKWEVRSASGIDLTFFVALSEEAMPLPQGRGQLSKIQVCVEPGKFKHPMVAMDASISATVSRVYDNLYSLVVSGPNEFQSKDVLTAAEFLPVLSKRLSNILQLNNQIKTSPNTKTLISQNQHILQSLRIITTEMVAGTLHKDRSARPPSPVKLLANIFGGGSIRESPRKHGTTLSLTDIPQLTPMRRKSDEASQSTNVSHLASNALEKLEETLSSYVLALHSRKGNIVGKVLRARSLADELAVNELYNILLESPENYQLAAQVSVDVLFSSFEKFMRVAWQDKMGPLFSIDAWHTLRSKLDSFQPGEFEDTFRIKLSDMSPQNQRALKSIMKLLVDLLEGTGNDGDRGILTASFAEVLVPDENVNHFVSLLDRLVEDIDPLLNNRPYEGHGLQPGYDYSKSNTGSVTSNTSSFRKKFGLLGRMGSKIQPNEPESDNMSVWRTLSKSKHDTVVQPSSPSKPSSIRGNPADASNAKRPNSRDRPNVLGAFPFENPRPLSVIGEGHGSERPRKKRRSSLSDIVALHHSANNTPSFIATPKKLGSSPAQSPQTPSPTKQSFIPQPSPTYQSHSSRPSSPNRRDQSPLKATSPPKLKPLPTPDENGSPRRRNTNASAIPTLRQTPGILSERPTSGNARKLPAPPVQLDKPLPMENIAPLNLAAGKLRMQSPQKIRERLAAETKAAIAVENSLHSDLAKMNTEVASQSRPGSGTGSGPPSRNGASTPVAPEIKILESKLATIASKHAQLLTSMKSRLDSLSSDLTSSLQVSEQKARGLDELYREANAENEALYARFNEELASILALVKGGEGQKETVRRLKDTEEENAKLRRENGRLRREVVGLRAQLKE